MKKLLIALLALSSISAFASDYVCERANPANSDNSTYVLKVYKKSIKLGYHESDLKKGDIELNRNQNYLKPLLQFGGEINELRGEGYLKAYITPSMTADAERGVMYLEWGYKNMSRVSKYFCLNH